MYKEPLLFDVTNLNAFLFIFVDFIYMNSKHCNKYNPLKILNILVHVYTN